MTKQIRAQLDEIGENVRRARAIAHLAQLGTDQSTDLSLETGLAMSVVEGLLLDAESSIESLEAS